MTAERHAAYLAAYDLWEAVQTERHADAAGEITQAARVAERQQWPEVAVVLAGAQVVHSLTRAEDPVAAVHDADALVARAERLEAPALFAVALALRAITASATGDTAALMADAGRAVVLLDDPTQPALDRCTGYVTAGAAFNTLQLWELVDELYTRATDLEPDCPVPAQAPALAVNRVLTRLEWALTLIEVGEEKEAQDRLAEVASAVGAAEKCDRLPPLWRADIEACEVVVDLLRGQLSAAVRARAAGLRDVLEAGDDIEALPLLDAAAALALWRAGHVQEATDAVERVTPLGSASSGSRSFPAWVRAEILAGTEPSEAVRAQRAHTQLVSRLRWESRRAVLAAARAQIAAERHRGERDRLAHAVNTDPLTGLSNRRPFDAWLNERTVTAPLPTALLLADIDDFKAINDTHGHGAGDRVLRRFGELLLGCVRPGDMAVRHGGDEFAVVLQGEHLTEEAAVRRAEQLRSAVAAEPWSDLSPDVHVTATIGVAIATTSSPDNLAATGSVPEAIYRAADGALYAAKRTGSGLEVATIGTDGATT